MKKKMLIISMLITTIGMANIREYKPDFDKIDKYEGYKKAAGVLQEFNYVTPSYNYGRNYNYKENKYNNSNNINVKWGDLNYSYGVEDKIHGLSFNKNLSEIFDTGIIKNYYSKLEEFYSLKEKKKMDYKNIIDAYYDYLFSKLELDNSKEYLNSVIENIKVSKAQYEMGKISRTVLDEMLIKEELAKLDYEKNLLAMESKISNLDYYDIDKASINDNDIDIYKLTEDNIKNYVLYENAKIENKNKLKKYTNLKSDIDVFMPDIIVGVNQNFKDGSKTRPNFNFSISKSFNIADSKYVDNKISKDTKVIPTIDLKKELKQYDILKKMLKIKEKQFELAKKELEIAKVKLELGKIDRLKYMDKLQDYSNQKILLIKTKISLSKYILERE